MSKAWTLEDDVTDYVKNYFLDLELVKHTDFNVESSMSEYMKEALKGSAKTENKTNFGKPDLHIEKYDIPVIIENKLGLKRLINFTKKDGIKTDAKSVRDYAVNGALFYATEMIASDKYEEVIAIGIAGDSPSNIEIKVYYVFGASIKSIKDMKSYESLDFLENEVSFKEFYLNAILTDKEKHKILINSKKELNDYAKKLNKLLHHHNIAASQRVLYVSGMLLSMQDIKDKSGGIIQVGLIPNDLKGIQTDTKRDGKLIVEQIEEYLHIKSIQKDKVELMLASFKEISKDNHRDEKNENHKEVANLLNGESSINKQIFTFIYEYVFKQIDNMAGHLDIMGEMYSEFLKYALGDGKEIGIVLTPPYITNLMSQLLNINKDSKVMDLATGSAGFLISSMELMIEDTERSFGKETTKSINKIKEIKQNQLLGVELSAEMFTLAATNMILRGDGSSNIKKANTFKTPKSLYDNFSPDRLLLNPPFSYSENGMPFLEFGLNYVQKGGYAGIIIQDSAGSGKSSKTNRKILKNHTLIASIKMPSDLFVPMAGVQTSIYIFEAGTPHDFDKTVKFIDFRNDGYKRTKRGTMEIDAPSERYESLIRIYKAGKHAKINPNLFNLNQVYIEDFIDDSGSDWNFNQHVKIDLAPTFNDIKRTVSSYLDNRVKYTSGYQSLENISLDAKELDRLKEKFLANNGSYKTFYLYELFDKKTIKGVPKYDENLIEDPDGYHIFGQNIKYQYPQKVKVDSKYLQQVEKSKPILAYTSSSAEIGIIDESFYRSGDNGAFQGLFPKFEKYNRFHLIYILSLLEKYFILYGYSTGMADIINLEIELPTENNEINFEYMENYIKEVQKLYISELDMYRIKEISMYNEVANESN